MISLILRFFMIAVVVLNGSLLVARTNRETETIESFKIEPDTFYKLSFTGRISGEMTAAQWIIRMRCEYGNLPYDGNLNSDWQILSTGNKAYIHTFLSARKGRELRFKIAWEGEKPQVSHVKLDRIDPPNLLLNCDFELGGKNFSGWSETYKTDIIRKENGNSALRINLNGYALSDYFPVIGGGGYEFIAGAQTWPGVSVLAYDANKRLIERVPRNPGKNPSLRMPVNAAYARILFNTSHDHITSHRTVTIGHTGLKLVEEPTEISDTGLINDGFSETEIVLYAGGDAREERAAKELQYWVQRITGRTIPILTEPSASDNLKIRIGTEWAGKFASDLEYLQGSDGYAVRREANNIYIFGGHPRSVLFAVYALLEKNTDIIWPRPNPEYSAIFSQTPEIEFNQADFRSRPAFKYRQISNRYSFRDEYIFHDWLVRNGLSTGHPMHRGFDFLSWQRGARPGYGGSYITWLGRSGEMKDEFYPLVDGERSVNRWRQPCYTHPEIVERLASSFRQALEKLPGDKIRIEHLQATIADNWTVCACDRCMQPVELGNNTVLEPQSRYANQDPLFFSTRNFIMLNQVAEKVVEDYPDFRFHTHAYIFTAEPPAVEIHPAIIPEFAAYPTQNVRYPITSGRGREISIYDPQIWKRRFRQWGDKELSGLGFFGYYYTPGFNALADTAVADYRDLLAFGGIEAHTEGFPVDQEGLSSWDADGIEKWVIARSMWDPDQDPKQLRADYIERVYRDAAAPMKDFYRLIRESWHAAPEDVFVNCHSAPDFLFETFIVEPGLEKILRELLISAEQAATHPVTEKLISRKIRKFDEYAASLGRHSVPYVPESTVDWSDPIPPPLGEGG